MSGRSPHPLRLTTVFPPTPTPHLDIEINFDKRVKLTVEHEQAHTQTIIKIKKLFS